MYPYILLIPWPSFLPCSFLYIVILPVATMSHSDCLCHSLLRLHRLTLLLWVFISLHCSSSSHSSKCHWEEVWQRVWWNILCRLVRCFRDNFTICMCILQMPNPLLPMAKARCSTFRQPPPCPWLPFMLSLLLLSTCTFANAFFKYPHGPQAGFKVRSLEWLPSVHSHDHAQGRTSHLSTVNQYKWKPCYHWLWHPVKAIDCNNHTWAPRTCGEWNTLSIQDRHRPKASRF